MKAKGKEIDETKIPQEILALIKKKAAQKPETIDNTELVKEFRAEGGNIVHCRPIQIMDRKTRGLTVAYKVKGKRVEVATALTHTTDTFSKKHGTKTAIEHFREGKTVVLPLSGRERAVDEVAGNLGMFCV